MQFKDKKLYLRHRLSINHGGPGARASAFSKKKAERVKAKKFEKHEEQKKIDNKISHEEEIKEIEKEIEEQVNKIRKIKEHEEQKKIAKQIFHEEQRAALLQSASRQNSEWNRVREANSIGGGNRKWTRVRLLANKRRPKAQKRGLPVRAVRAVRPWVTISNETLDIELEETVDDPGEL